MAEIIQSFGLNRSRNGGELAIEGVALSELAERYGTPLYLYSKAGIKGAFSEFRDANWGSPSIVCVSVKANSNLSILAMLARLGAGFDVVSIGELQRALTAGADPKKVVFAGVGKTDEEIIYALRSGILMLNVESVEELGRINELAEGLGTKAPVAIRVNPDIDAKTHAHISTGLEEHKFGVPLTRAQEIYLTAEKFPYLEFVGVDCHIGSMITDMEVFHEAFEKLARFVGKVRHAVPTLKYLDLGGGLAVPYKGENFAGVAEYSAMVRRVLSDLGMTLLFEPGRAIFANSGVLLTRVIFSKKTARKQFVIVDAGFNDLIRPLLYEAYHHIEPVIFDSSRERVQVDLVGPICESGDCFAHDRELQELKRDELVALCSAGAYGFVMASNYNTRPRPAEILVDGEQSHVIRPRETVDKLLSEEVQALEMLEIDKGL